MVIYPCFELCEVDEEGVALEVRVQAPEGMPDHKQPLGLAHNEADSSPNKLSSCMPQGEDDPPASMSSISNSIADNVLMERR